MAIKNIPIYVLSLGILYFIFTQKSQIIKRIISFRFSACIFKNNVGNELQYRLYKPTFKKNTRYPFILYLHGAGSCGNDNISQLNETVHFLSSKNVQDNHPCIIMAPQCPAGKQWLNTTFKKTPFDHYHQKEIPESEEIKMIVNVINQLKLTLPVDNKKIYVIGFSMGSSGTWDIISRYPDLFSAAIPISGVSDTATAPRINHLSIWAFHGKNDDIAPVRLNQEMQQAIIKAGGKCNLTTFENLGHSCEKNAIHQNDLLDWLFVQ